MSDLKDQQKKLLRAQVAGKTMEYLIGLNEKNKPAIRRVVEKSVKKIVTSYYEAIKQQHKKVLKQTAKKDRENKVLTGGEPVEFTEQTNLKAS
jgi:hypothetical protein